MAATLSELERVIHAFRKSADLDEAELANSQLTDFTSLRQEINTIQN